MSQLFSFKGAWPYPLPEDMTGYDLGDFVPVSDPPVLLPGQNLDWDGSAWFIRPASPADLELAWARVREERDRLLAASDVFVVRAYEKGDPVPQETVAYRQALRDVTKQVDPFTILWPDIPAQPF